MSYVLHAAGLLDEALDSTGFMSWGESGKGTWVTNYANSGHSYMVIAGLRFDTSGRADDGSRWDAEMRSSSRLHGPPPGGPVVRRVRRHPLPAAGGADRCPGASA